MKRDGDDELAPLPIDLVAIPAGVKVDGTRRLTSASDNNARRAGENARFAGGSISKVANKSCFFKRMQKGREEVDLAVDRCVRR